MKNHLKLVFILSVLFLSLTLPSFSQVDTATTVVPSYPDQPEDDFNAFLFLMVVFIFSAIAGAAMIGAFAATLLLLLLLGLVTIGLVSTSIIIGIYKRSFTAGFKSLLLLFFGFSCSIIGAAGMYAIDRTFHLPMPLYASLFIGFAAGATGGLLMALATTKVIRSMIKCMVKKLQLSVQ